MQKRWSKAEIAHLERNSSKVSPEELAQKFQTDVETVQRKLEEMRGANSSDDGKDLDGYSEALRFLCDQQWQQAAEIFERLIEQTDSRHFADRARMKLITCQRHLAKPDEKLDPYLAAVFEKNQGNLDAALQFCSAQNADDERFAYLVASIHSLAGEEDKAMSALETAIRLEPKNRIHAYHDPDFADLRGQEGFTSLISSDDGSS